MTSPPSCAVPTDMQHESSRSRDVLMRAVLFHAGTAEHDVNRPESVIIVIVLLTTNVYRGHRSMDKQGAFFENDPRLGGDSDHSGRVGAQQLVALGSWGAIWPAAGDRRIGRRIPRWRAESSVNDLRWDARFPSLSPTSTSSTKRVCSILVVHTLSIAAIHGHRPSGGVSGPALFSLLLSSP